MENRSRLLWAGFMAILAAGVGFAIRGGIFDNWKLEFGFTDTQLGDIGGAGFTSFCFGIILGGIIADKIGYGKLVLAAFLLHVLSAVLTFTASSKETAYLTLYWGMFLFGFANGTLEAVVNPVVATLYPENRTHYLNILHASWPGGMILGAVAGWILDDAMEIDWRIQLALYLLPTVAYGLMFLGQKQPKSEASEKGLSLQEMFKDVGLLGAAVACFLLALFFGEKVFGAFLSGDTPTLLGYAVAGAFLVVVGLMTKFSLGSFLLFILFVAHMLVGAVELGTDQWIQNITGNLLTSGQGKALFIWTNIIMFSLRFCAHFIEKKIGLSPVGILLTCAVLAVAGLVMASNITSFGFALVALGIYAVGKTFYWPTQLAVIGDRFPRTGAVAISMTAGIGMLSAGLIGSQGLGYAKDRFASEELKKADAALYEQVKAKEPSNFRFFGQVTAIDGAKLEEVKKKDSAARSPQDSLILEAELKGNRKTLVADAFIPGMMAVIYLGILLYFKTIGGYKAVRIEGDPPPAPPPQAAVSDRS